MDQHGLCFEEHLFFFGNPGMEIPCKSVGSHESYSPMNRDMGSLVS